MLSDESIRRDKNYSLPRRVLLRIRKMVAPRYREKLNAQIRQTLGEVSFTVFSNNCLGGVFYHDAGRQFTSPLINTAMDGEDFVRFLERPQYYLSCPMKFVTWPGHNYPIARIDDIEIRFVHYQSSEEAEEKFRERAKRIVWDNIFVIATNHDGLNHPKWMERFNRLPYENKLMYTSQEYPDYPWAICVPQFKGRFQVRIMTNMADFKGRRYYETAYDLPAWIAGKSR